MLPPRRWHLRELPLALALQASLRPAAPSPSPAPLPAGSLQALVLLVPLPAQPLAPLLALGVPLLAPLIWLRQVLRQGLQLLLRAPQAPLQ